MKTMDTTLNCKKRQKKTELHLRILGSLLSEKERPILSSFKEEGQWMKVARRQYFSQHVRKNILKLNLIHSEMRCLMKFNSMFQKLIKEPVIEEDSFHCFKHQARWPFKCFQLKIVQDFNNVQNKMQSYIIKDLFHFPEGFIFSSSFSKIEITMSRFKMLLLRWLDAAQNNILA